jgi:hypothetical protein
MKKTNIYKLTKNHKNIPQYNELFFSNLHSQIFYGDRYLQLTKKL